MKIVDLSDIIYQNLNRPDSISIASIAYWIRSKLGNLNSLIFETYSINSALEIVDSAGEELSNEAASILEKMYEIYYLDCQIRGNIGSGSYDLVQSVDDSGGKVTMVNRNEIAKTLSAMKKQEQDNLNQLISSYKIRGSSVCQVAGDDSIPANVPNRQSQYRQYPELV